MEGNKKLELRSTGILVERGENNAPTDPSRRQFMNKALTLSATVALSGLVPHLKSAPLQGAACTPVTGQELENPGHITPQVTSGDHKVLQAVLRVTSENRKVSYLDVNGTPATGNPTCGSFMLRAYEGFSGTTTDPKNRVTKSGEFNPGPTFRAAVGDTLQVAVLNHINPKDFPETAAGTCDTNQSNTGTKIYPGVPPKPPCPDTAPDCFRGSNTTNVHWHGTHVSPNAFSDNVLVEIVPDLQATAADCQPWWPVACVDYPNPQAWKHLDAKTEKTLNQLIQKNLQCLEKLDLVQPEKNDKTLHKRQADQNRHLIEFDEFPQYWCGCFPYCIRPPKYVPPVVPPPSTCPPQPEPKPKFVMGQAPGTHWYHAHKHGSTSIQSLNGMAGALILTDDEYDGKLLSTMKGIKEKILVLQQFQVQPNMVRTGGVNGASPAAATAAHPGVLVNGQLQPKITMMPGEVQWWRIINASIEGGKSKSFTCAFSTTSNAGVPTFRQIAQDGVQFDWKNYEPQIQQFTPKTFFLAPGNRVDLLVQAGAQGQQAILGFGTGVPTGTDIILTVNVVSASGSYNKTWPQTEGEYPKLPDFLHDIDQVSESRILNYQMSATGAPPMINNRKFEEGRVDEAMLLDTMQEWTIKNYSTGGNAMHPFHIHVNPFQVVEIFDPTGSIVNNVFTGIPASFGDWGKVIPQISTSKPMILPAPWIWWDTFALPMAKDANTPGYIKFRTHFADFAGKFVNHCHILAHEDRGMMQLIEVVDNKTVVQHR
jgi:FtsP/CotA-like multicopper oxidase with cupredoxin domain